MNIDINSLDVSALLKFDSEIMAHNIIRKDITNALKSYGVLKILRLAVDGVEVLVFDELSVSNICDKDKIPFVNVITMYHFYKIAYYINGAYQYNFVIDLHDAQSHNTVNYKDGIWDILGFKLETGALYNFIKNIYDNTDNINLADKDRRYWYYRLKQENCYTTYSGETIYTLPKKGIEHWSRIFYLLGYTYYMELNKSTEELLTVHVKKGKGDANNEE